MVSSVCYTPQSCNTPSNLYCCQISATLRPRLCPCRTSIGVLADVDECASWRPGNCWCDKFCSDAGDCCDDCPSACPGVTCPARARLSAAESVDSSVEPALMGACGADAADDLASAFKKAALNRGGGVSPAAYTGDLEARVQSCQDDRIQRDLSDEIISIPTYVVNVGLGNDKAQYSSDRANLLIQGINTAYARTGFQFTLQKYVEGFTFTSQSTLDANDCGPGNPNCERCRYYRQIVPTKQQGSKVLVLYMTPYPQGGQGAFVVGSAFKPQTTYQPYLTSNVLDDSCIDGAYGVTYPASAPGGLAFALKRDVANMVHEVGNKCCSVAASS